MTDKLIELFVKISGSTRW